MNKILLCFSMLFLVQSALAKEVYQCKVNGSTVFQGKPCAGAGETVGDRINKQKAQAAMERRRLQALEESRNQYQVAKPQESKIEKVESQSTNMNFNTCKAKVTAAQLGVVGTKYKTTTIVNATDMYVARICTNDGSILMTCSKANNKLVTTSSPYCP